MQSTLGLRDAPEWDNSDDYDKDSMLNELDQEINQIKSLQNYFSNSTDHPVHAVGVVVMSNANEHIKYNANPYYIVNVIWRYIL